MGINLDELIDAAIDGQDWRAACEFLLAHKKSCGLPSQIAVALFRVAHELPGHERYDAKKYALAADRDIRGGA
ncbi:MAG: hypothetical protein VW257_04630 [Quisquiliibacterium sp.]